MLVGRAGNIKYCNYKPRVSLPLIIQTSASDIPKLRTYGRGVPYHHCSCFVPDVSSVISSIQLLLSVFGIPAYYHLGQWSSHSTAWALLSGSLLPTFLDDGRSIFLPRCWASVQQLAVLSPRTMANSWLHDASMVSSLQLWFSGAATVVDLFFFHQRYVSVQAALSLTKLLILFSGRAIGTFTVLMTNGGHMAPIVGDLLGQYCGWRCN